MKIVQIITPGEGNMDLKLQLKYIVGKHLRYESDLEFLDKCYENSVIPKGFQWKWSVQLDATAEEEKKFLKVREDAALKLIGLSRSVCVRKCNELQQEMQACYDRVGYEDRSEVRKWAIAEKGRLNCLKDKKFLTLKKGSHRHSSLTSGYRVVGIERDGNCFFRCLSQLIHGTQMRHACLRRDLVQYMSCNKDLYCQLVDGSMEDHLHHLEFTDGRTLSWATEAELKAAADWYNMEILVAQNRQFLSGSSFLERKLMEEHLVSVCVCSWRTTISVYCLLYRHIRMQLQNMVHPKTPVLIGMSYQRIMEVVPALVRVRSLWTRSIEQTWTQDRVQEETAPKGDD